MKLLLNDKVTTYLKISMLFISILNWEYLKGENTSVVQVVPVSPTAASLGQFGYIPVGHYTGTADISVPLYEIALDGKKFPINIAYHASGIKVAQESGCIGLGWALQGYGAITKQVRGFDDFESSPKGYYWNTNLPIPTEDNGYDYQNGSVSECKDYSIYSQRDGEPDLFHFNFGNYSGTMFFQCNGVGNNLANRAYPLLTKVKDNLKVEYNIESKSWEIVDGDGYIYYFNTYEMTESYQFSTTSNSKLSNTTRGWIMHDSRGIQPDVITTWYLDSIVSPQKNKITFEYGEDYIYTQKQRQETIYHLVDAVPARFASGMIHDLENYVYSFSKINQKVLKKIVTDLLTIEIITDNRLDIESVQTTKLPQKVSEIKIKDNSGLVVKNIIFDYEYVGLVSNYCSCRLFLKRVTDKAGEERHVYEFTYDRASKLPNKDSNAIDDWGYYNGKTISDRRWGTEQQQGGESNITYVPAYRLKTMSPLSGYTYDLSYLGRSREVVNEYVTCGMLSSMKYPTGLITNFEYEPHAVQNGSNSTLQKEQVVLGVAYYQNFLWDEDEDENMYENSKMAAFTLTKETEITLQWRVLTYDEEPKKDEDGEVSFYRCAFLKNESGKILKEISVVEREMGRFILQKLVLPAGKYTVNVATQNIITPGNYGMSLSVSMEVVKNIDTNVVSKGGGVRVKRIYSTFEGKIISDLKYSYMKKGKSTGLLMNSPVFTYPFTTRNLTLRGVYDIGGVRVDVIDVTGFYVCGMSYPYTPFSFSAMGASVGYSTVTVRENFCTGYEEYSYYNVPDRALSSDESYIPGFPTTGSLRNGQLLSKILYDDDGGKVEETNYIYTVDRQETVKGFKAYIPLIFSTFSTSEFDYIYARFYDTVSERWNLTREITTTYDPNNYGSNYGTPSVQFYKDYKYLSSNDLPSMVSYGNSDKSIRQIQYKYSTDYADQMSQKMKNRNLVNKPLETIYMCDGSVTKAEKTSYIDTLGLILPKIVYALKASSPLSLSMYSSFYRKKYSIDLYNKHGKIVQMSEKDNIPVTYLWGYKSIYPIAEIRNATYNEVAMHLRNMDSFENSLSPIMTSIENLRSLLKKSLITTYTYKVPWGIQKIVSPTGMNTTYNYDLFGRLQTILDHNGKVVKRLKYNYKQ
ncbi:hypothetical protein [Bacteroides salyersiae]|jgi:hypothetical protein|uniref:hypothetical protein n=2 Tax=Bacteroides salyersiae TaxID=291644 RepID=UPI00032716F3|nr:hypothetical protein [Bacteroides salyersiae]EOA50519.1 YD repeat (two copies) [Bacteroides salyersiae WAL 10018 = DSM 18765 = JCM 12988]